MGKRLPSLFMFKLPAGDGTTYEAVEHNNALDKDSGERREAAAAARWPGNAADEGRRIVSGSSGGLTPRTLTKTHGRRRTSRRAVKDVRQRGGPSPELQRWLMLSAPSLLGLIGICPPFLQAAAPQVTKVLVFAQRELIKAIAARGGEGSGRCAQVQLSKQIFKLAENIE